MSLIVQKFGGTSVRDPERIAFVAERVAKARAAGDSVVVVVSAMAGETDRLIGLARASGGEQVASANPRELDVLLATGEQVTIALLAMALQRLGVPARSYTGGQVRISTDSAHAKARILSIAEDRVRGDLDVGRVVVVAGFQGVDEHDNITTLGRGGSDTTAVALAAALDADECQIFTDVDGVYTTDPRIVPEARRMERVTFEEMLEMASLGAKVLQIRAVEFASKYGVRLRVLSSFEPLDSNSRGTLIGPDDYLDENEERKVEQPLISGIAFTRDEAKLTLTGAPDQPGIAFGVLGPIADANIDVDMIVQNAGLDGTTDFTFTVPRGDYARARAIVEEHRDALGGSDVVGDEQIVKVSLVGVGMRSHAGIASRMFDALSREGINIQMISTSEIKISVVVSEKYLELAVRCLHDEFDLAAPVQED